MKAVKRAGEGEKLFKNEIESLSVCHRVKMRNGHWVNLVSVDFELFSNQTIGNGANEKLEISNETFRTTRRSK